MTDYDGLENNHVTGRIYGLHDSIAYNMSYMTFICNSMHTEGQ